MQVAGPHPDLSGRLRAGPRHLCFTRPLGDFGACGFQITEAALWGTDWGRCDGSRGSSCGLAEWLDQGGREGGDE